MSEVELRYRLWPRQKAALTTEATEVLFGGASEGGKALSLTTEVPTPEGIRLLGELKPGDLVFGPDGMPTRIIAKSEVIQEKTYRLTFDSGEHVIAGARHQWVTMNVRERGANDRRCEAFRAKRRAKRPLRGTGKMPWLVERNKAKRQVYKPQTLGTVRTTEEMAATAKTNGRTTYSIEMTMPLQMQAQPLPIDPYVLGVWLGDGTRGTSSYTGIDLEVAEQIRARGYTVEKKKGFRWLIRGLKGQLEALGCSVRKFIPQEYLIASAEQRLELLRGLMDTDGACRPDGQVEFCSIDRELSDGVAWLASSLGCKATIISKRPTCNGKVCATAYVVRWTGDLRCFYISRKLERLRAKAALMPRRRFVVKIEEVEPEPLVCIQVDNASSEYLITRSCIPTHNSHLIRIALITWCLAVPGLLCVLIRRKWSDILANHLEGPTGFRVLLAPLVSIGGCKITKEGITFKNGSIISFVHCQDERQFDSAQGTEKHVLVVDEATQISERLIRFFRTWCRMPKEYRETLPPEWRDKFPRILYTANPFGPSAPFFRRAFVKARPYGSIADVEGFKRQYIPSRAEDNLSIDLDAHKARLAGMHDPGLAKALDTGDWDSPIGEYFPQYDETRHVTPDFTPPSGWFKFLSFDWGSSEPFCVLWWCVSDGRRFTDGQGRERWFRRGALICYREWYGCDPQDPAKGLQMRNEEIAAGIVLRTPEKTSGLVVTDSLPFQDRGMSRGGKAYNIADVFADAGCPLVRGNTARVHGWAQVRDRLIGIDGDPLLLLAESCRYTRDYLPAIGRSPTNTEDAQEDGEATHACDCVRYACMTRPLIKDDPALTSEKDPNLCYTPKAPILPTSEILKRLETQHRGRRY